jgi:hypothetical protein
MRIFNDDLNTYVHCARTRIERSDLKRRMPQSGWVTGPNGGPSIKNGMMSRNLDWLYSAATADFDFEEEQKLCRKIRLSAPFSPLMDEYDFNEVWKNALTDSSKAIGPESKPAVFPWEKDDGHGYRAKWEEVRFKAQLTSVSGSRGRRIFFQVEQEPTPPASMRAFFVIEYS